TLVSDAIYDAFYGDFAELKTFFHGHSFTGNQLGCAVGLASLDLFEREGLVARVQESARFLERRLRAVAELPHVGDVRHRGLMVGIELVADRATKTSYDWRDRDRDAECVGARELRAGCRSVGVGDT